MIRRWWRQLALGLVVIAIAWFAWRWQGQRVDVVIVNASGSPATFEFQPSLFAALASVTIGGCESHASELLAGETWRFTAENVTISSSSVDIPLFTPEVAVEIWIAADGSSRFVRPYPIDGPLDAPHPSGCASIGG